MQRSVPATNEATQVARTATDTIPSTSVQMPVQTAADRSAVITPNGPARIDPVDAAGTAGEPAPAPDPAVKQDSAVGDADMPMPDASAQDDRDAIVEVVDVAQVWSGHPVHFDLVTHGDHQFVAFYDADRTLTVGQRRLGAPAFELSQLPSVLGWDSHNDVVLAVDADDHVHVAGNMHSTPLTYFRAARPLDVTSFESAQSMVGRDELACTYPQFFHSADNQLVFMYRSGSSGNGNHIFNAYDPATGRWHRLNGSALTDGQGQRNAYPVGPVQGPNGLFHLVWVWRDTPDAATNHNLSYARSADLMLWQGADGSPSTLPITLATGDIVDPVPTHAGMINNNTKVGFDGQGRPIVSYHKYDASGFTQLYNARFEDGRWVVHQASDWHSRWDFGGGGTLVFDVIVEPVEVQPDGTLLQRYYNANEGGQGAFRLSPETLAAESTIESFSPYPHELSEVEANVPGMEVRFQADRTANSADGLVYVLRWETLPSNRDQPRNWVPPSTLLRLYGLRR